MSQYSRIRRAGLPSIYVYDIPENLPLVNVTAGTIAFIESISGLFIYNNGWRPLSTSEDGPVITAAPLSITVESGTTYTTTIEAYDPDDLPIIYSITTTGSIAENTEVTIDEDTGVLTLLSNNPYADNFSIILTCSDGVFATTRTIPVTITNRLPSFTVEPAASQTASVGVEFSYQYAVTDPDDSTVLSFSVSEDLTTVFPNLQLMQRIESNPNFESNQGYKRYSSTGGDYIASVPNDNNPTNGISLYKLNTTTDLFELFQTGISCTLTPNTGMYFNTTAINNDFLFVSDFNETVPYTRTSKVLKYDSNTDQFVHWSGGDLGTILSNVDPNLKTDYEQLSDQDAIFAETPDGLPALVIGKSNARATGALGYLYLFVFDSANDTWIYKTRYSHTNSSMDLNFTGNGYTQQHAIEQITTMAVNNYRKYEFGICSNNETMTWEILTPDDQEPLATRIYNLEYRPVAASNIGPGRITTALTSTGWQPNGVWFSDENTLWCGHFGAGELFKIERGSSPDPTNNSTWVSADDVTGGTATITAYTNVSGSYTTQQRTTFIAPLSDGGNADNYNRLIINGKVGISGKNWFQVDDATNTVTYTNKTDPWLESADFEFIPEVYQSYTSTLTPTFNYTHNIVVFTEETGRITRGQHHIFGFGINTNVDETSTVTLKPRSFGTYNVTTSVSDTIDTITDVVSVEVPGGVQLTSVPPSSKTIDATSTQTFTTDVVGGNYNTDIPVIKFSSDLEHQASQTITGTQAVEFKNKLYVVENGGVKYYDIDMLGNVGSTGTTLDLSSYTNDNTPITGIDKTEDYLILKRKGTPSASANINRVGERYATQAVSWRTGTSGLILGTGDTYTYDIVTDLVQWDTDGTEFIEYYTNSFFDYSNSSNYYDTREWLTRHRKLSPLTNRMELIRESNQLTFTDSNSQREYIYFLKTYHREYTGDADTGKGLVAWRNIDTGALDLKTFDYSKTTIQDTGNYAVTFNATRNYNGDDYLIDSSPDSEWIAVAFGDGNTSNKIWLRGIDDTGNPRVWDLSQTFGTIGNRFRSLGWIKINSAWHLITLHDASGDYVVSIYNTPQTSSDVLSVESTYITNDSAILGPIAGDDSNNLVVGSKILSVSNLNLTLGLQTTINGIGFNSNISQKLEWDPNLSSFILFTRRVQEASGGLNTSTGNIELFTLHPITKAATLVSNTSYTANSGSSQSSVNIYGDFFANVSDPGTSVVYPQTVRFDGNYQRGSLFGPGGLLLFTDTTGTPSYHSSIEYNPTNNACLQNITGSIVQYKGVANNKTKLVIGYPWHQDEFSTDNVQGTILLYEYDSNTSQWTLLDEAQNETNDYNTGTRNNYVQYNNYGYSIAKYSDILLESGPRALYPDTYGNFAGSDNPVHTLAMRDDRLVVDKRYSKDEGQQYVNGYYALLYAGGISEQVLGKSYVAWANTGTQGLFKNSTATGGVLSVWNSSSNIPSVQPAEFSRYNKTSFKTAYNDIFYEPSIFDGSVEIDTNGELEIWEINDNNVDGPGKSFSPAGDYTLEFHYKQASSGFAPIWCAIDYNGNFNASQREGVKLYVNGTALVFSYNWSTNSGSLSLASVPGIYWSSIVPTDDTWHHYAIVYDSVNQQHTLWKDGVKVSTQSYASNPKIWKDGYDTPEYRWSIGNHRSTNASNSNQDSTIDFQVANLFITEEAVYNPSDIEINLSVFETGNVYDKLSANTWGAFCIGKNRTLDFTKNNFIRNAGTNVGPIPNTYTLQNLDNSLWTRYIDGNDSTIVTANDKNLYVFERGTDNRFNFDRVIPVTGSITGIRVLDNQVDTIVVETLAGIKIYNRNLGNYLLNPITHSNGTVTLEPKFLEQRSYTLKTIGSDNLDTAIGITSITQNAVLDLSSVTDRTISLEWGSTDTQTLPVSNDYTTNWTTQFTNTGNPSSQLQLSGNTLTVTPSNVSHDTFAANLVVSLGGETKTVANYKYQTYAPWKYGPADQFDYATEDQLTSWRGLTPSLDGDDSNDQSYMYGRSVSLSEIDVPNSTGYLAVGQPRSNWDNTGVMTATGEVYVYQWNDSQGADELSFVGNAHQQRIQNSITFGTDTDTQGQHFGWVVDITADGETILATAPGIDTLSVDETANSSGQAGAVIYTRQSDGTHAVSTSIDFADITLGGSQLGTAAAISDDASTIVFGSANYPVNTNQNGLVSIWRKTASGSYTSFALIDHVTNNWANGSRTGESVAVSADGSVVAIGQPGDSNALSGNVLVYKYTNNGYQFVQTLSQNLEGDDFGYSVAMTPDGGTIVVGTPGVQPTFGDTNTGGFIVYDGNTTNGYTQTFVYTPEISTGGVVSGERIGTSVTIDKFGSTIIAGGPFTSGAPRTGGSRSVNNYNMGHVYTAYKTSGSWNKGSFYIPDAVDNYIRGDGTFASNSGWKNKTFGYSVALSPNGNHLAVGDPTLGGEVPYTTPEVVYTFTPAVIRLRQQILDLNPTLFNTSNIDRSTGILVTINPITMGTGSPISIELPVDFWPTGIASFSDYSANVFSGTGGVSVSLNSSTNSLEIAHTRNTSTVSQGFSLIALDLSFKTINDSFVFRIGWQ